jgi:putative transposase
LDVKKRFSEEQIIGFLREAEKGIPVKDLCRKHGFSDASFYLWRGKYGGMDVSDAKRLKALEAENARLKRLLPGGQVKLLHPWPGQNPPPLRRGDGWERED